MCVACLLQLLRRGRWLQLLQRNEFGGIDAGVAGSTVRGLLALTTGFALSTAGPNNNPGPAVPEASTWTMMLLGFMGMGFMAYRRRGSTMQFRAA